MSVMDTATVSFTKHGHIFVNPMVLDRLYNKKAILKFAINFLFITLARGNAFGSFDSATVNNQQWAV